VVRQCGVNSSWGYWLLSNALIVAIFPIIQMQVQSLALESPKTQDFDTKFQVLHQ
jgi:hypothetical protein